VFLMGQLDDAVRFTFDSLSLTPMYGPAGRYGVIDGLRTSLISHDLFLAGSTRVTPIWTPQSRRGLTVKMPQQVPGPSFR
jgi:hypothetical protein